MFQLGQVKPKLASQQWSSGSFEDMQFQICSSYIKYASQKLTLKETEIILQTSQFLNKLARQDSEKDYTELCTTDASYDSYLKETQDIQWNHKFTERKTAFKRKSKYAIDRKTQNNIGDALQQMRQVCSQRTVIVMEGVVSEMRRKSGQLWQSESRQAVLRKKKEKCETCSEKDSLLELKSGQFQEKIRSLKLEIQNLNHKNSQLIISLDISQKQHREFLQQNRHIFTCCREFLYQKENTLANKVQQLKTIESNIQAILQKVGDVSGCKRCEIVRNIKSQIIQVRRYYQRECEAVEKLYAKYRKTFRG